MSNQNYSGAQVSTSKEPPPTMAELVQKPTGKPRQSEKMNPQDIIPKPKKQLIRFVNQLHERREAFKAALDWVGIFVTKEELLAWIGDRNKELFNDRKL